MCSSDLHRFPITFGQLTDNLQTCIKPITWKKYSTASTCLPFPSLSLSQSVFLMFPLFSLSIYLPTPTTPALSDSPLFFSLTLLSLALPLSSDLSLSFLRAT